MKILISTGVYPPKIGGPAQYSKNLKEVFEKRGHNISISTFSFENYLPTGLRHIWFFIKIIPNVLSSDKVLVMDTFSVGFPTILASKIFGKESIIRTGGDFLWEQYVERTGKKILFRNFYNDEKNKFSLKEKIIFVITKWTMRNASATVFSTEWQREIFIPAYDLQPEKTSVIENYYGPKEGEFEAKNKIFVGSARNLVWKNLDLLKKVFDKVRKRDLKAELFLENLPFEDFTKEIKSNYAVILVSLGDISPNLVLDAIRHNKPFICTKEVGIYDRIKNIGIFVDPLNEDEIEEAVLKLLDKEEYEKWREKVRNFSFTHTWEEIADEFLMVNKSIK